MLKKINWLKKCKKTTFGFISNDFLSNNLYQNYLEKYQKHFKITKNSKKSVKYQIKDSIQLKIISAK